MANALTRILFDPVDLEGDRVPTRFRLSDDSRWWAVPVGAGVALLALGVVLGLANGGSPRVLFAYLIGWSFCLSVAIGALFFVMIQHLTKARWSVTIRRIPEALAASFPILALAGIPILLGMHDLYHWTHHELFDPASPEYDSIIAGKEAYLNIPFFVARYVVYFAIFTWLGSQLYKLSVRNDSAPEPAEHALAAQGERVRCAARCCRDRVRELRLSHVDGPTLVLDHVRHLLLRRRVARCAVLRHVPGAVAQEGWDVGRRDGGAHAGYGQVHVRLRRVLDVHRVQPVHALLVRQPA